MTPENFIYWLQGKLEIGDTKTLNEEEVQVIKDHIALVLKKETPLRQFTQLDQQIIPPTCDSIFGCGNPNCIKCLNKNRVLTC